MDSKLPWTNIHSQFKGQWVELVEYEWDWDKRYPTAARVRHHAVDREALHSMIKQNGRVEGSAVMFLGAARSIVARPEEIAH